MFPVFEMFSAALVKIGIGAAIMLALFGWHVWDRAQAYGEGERAERLVWEELRRRAEAKALAARQAAEARIRTIEADYFQRATIDAERVRQLQEDLAHEKMDDGGAAAGGCDDLVSRRMRDRLQPIGRD